MEYKNDLQKIRRIQNRIFEYDNTADLIEQDFLYFLGNHPYLFAEFIEPGFLTTSEMNYIVQHFNDYKVDPRTFENEFKRAMREALPRYNNMKAMELVDEVFDTTDDKWVRKIVKARATSLAQNGTRNTTSNTSQTANNKRANKELGMESDGTTFDNTVNWGSGASNIGEDKSTGSSNISQTDLNTLTNNGTDNSNDKEEYERHKLPVESIDKIWNYLVKPKAIDYLTSQLSVAFILIL